MKPMEAEELRVFRIGGITLRLSPRLLWDPVWDRFLCPPSEDIRETDITVTCEGESCWYHNVRKIELGAANSILLLHEGDGMAVSADWRLGHILSLKNPDSQTALLLQLFYAHGIRRRMIQLHASLIDWKGRGILFLGPSGVGKTTQAELWQQYRGARIINGDIVYVQERAEGFYGLGTPWHGSSPYCENDSVPLAGLVVLKQRQENSIRPLSRFELVSRVADSLFYPQWAEGGMEICLEVLDHLLKALPVYELACRPDEEAVVLTEHTVVKDE